MEVVNPFDGAWFQADNVVPILLFTLPFPFPESPDLT